MSIDHTLLNRRSEPVRRRWTHDDVMLYALTVGAGQADPGEELQFTTENSDGPRLTVLPTFVNVLLGGNILPLGDFHMAQLIHGENRFTLHAPLPPEGELDVTSEIVGIYDKGSAALLIREYQMVDTVSAGPLATVQQSIFIRGEGGFGGEPAPATAWEGLNDDPSIILDFQTRPEQALLYRLTGDRNPLHSDPVFSARGGFEKPILHGLCTYGYAGRLLLHALCGSDPARFTSMSARFTSPVIPGDRLALHVWDRGSEALFQVRRGQEVVLDRGRIGYTRELSEVARAMATTEG